MDSEDESFRQVFPLVMVVVAAIAVLCLVTALVVGRQDTVYIPSGMTEADVITKRVQPIGEVNMGGPVVAEASADSGGEESSEPREGKVVYNNVCSACHDSGTLGAPKFGNTAAWKPRAQKGLDTLAKHSHEGYKKMPAQKASASMEEIHRAIKYILSEAGLKP